MKRAAEQVGLPQWWFPLAYWVAVALLALGTLLPRLAPLPLAWLMLVPAATALRVTVSAFRGGDRRLALAALVAALGIMLVFLLKGVLSRH